MVMMTMGVRMGFEGDDVWRSIGIDERWDVYGCDLATWLARSISTPTSPVYTGRVENDPAYGNNVLECERASNTSEAYYLPHKRFYKSLMNMRASIVESVTSQADRHTNQEISSILGAAAVFVADEPVSPVASGTSSTSSPVSAFSTPSSSSRSGMSSSS